MEQKKKFSKEELSEQVRILRQMIAKNDEAMEDKVAEETEVVFSLKDVKTLCDMVLTALGTNGSGEASACKKGDEPATVKGQRRPRRGRRDGHRLVVSSKEKSNEIYNRLVDVCNEYEDYEDAASLIAAIVALLCAAAGRIKEDSHGVRLGLEGKFEAMEPVLLESLRREGKNYGLDFDEWLNLD